MSNNIYTAEVDSLVQHLNCKSTWNLDDMLLISFEKSQFNYITTPWLLSIVDVGKSSSTENPKQDILISQPMGLLQVYLWYVHSKNLINLNASRRNLFGSFQNMGCFPQDSQFPVANLWPVLLKNIKVTIQSFSKPMKAAKRNLLWKSTQTWRKATCQWTTQ